MQQAVSNLEPLIDERQAVVSYDLQATDPLLFADRNYLLIVITNLVDNAIKYAKLPQVLISTKNSGRAIHFTIADNGIGIEKEQVKNIFKKFFRVRTGETYTAKGFGLGLSFVKKIINAHKGKITVESKPGKGSSFTIELPTQ